MGTFSRHSCSKFTLRISHWLPSASRDRASRAPEDYNSINTFLFAILFPCLNLSLPLFFPLYHFLLPRATYHLVGPAIGESVGIFELLKQTRVQQVRRRLSFRFARAHDTKRKKSLVHSLSPLVSPRLLAIFENCQNRRVSALKGNYLRGN